MKKPLIKFFDTYCLLVAALECIYGIYTCICGTTWSVIIANNIYLYTFYIVAIIYIALYLIFKLRKNNE